MLSPRSRPLRSVALLLVAVGAALPACSSAGDAANGGGSSASPETYIDALCTYYERCSVDYSAQLAAQQRVVQGFLLDSSSGAYLNLCSASGRAALVAQVRYAMELPDTAPVDLQTAVAAVNATVCGELPNLPVVPGKRAPGSACLADGQCASATCSDQNGACGECVEAVRAGQRCDLANPKSVCERGTSCTSNVCTATASSRKVGDPCSAASDCPTAKGLTCSAGVCTSATAALGESCASKACRGSVCDAATKRCVALRTSGACTTSGQCNVFAGYACADASKTCEDFTPSVARAKVGEACGVSSGGSYTTCAVGLACDAATKACIEALSTCATR